MRVDQNCQRETKSITECKILTAFCQIRSSSTFFDLCIRVFNKGMLKLWEYQGIKQEKTLHRSNYILHLFTFYSLKV